MHSNNPGAIVNKAILALWRHSRAIAKASVPEIWGGVRNAEPIKKSRVGV